MGFEQDNKQIDMDIWTERSSRWTKFWMWVDDHNPLPYNIKYWFHDKDIFHPSRIFRKCQNVLRWIPILWNDVDWDYSSLLVMMHTKIKYMKVHHINHHNHTDWETLVKQMQDAEDALNRLTKNDYIEDAWEKHRQKWKDPFDTMDQWEKTPEGHRIMPAMSDEEHVEFKKLVDEEEKRIQDDYTTVANVFIKYVRGWWD